MKILVGIMHCIENEFEQCCGAIDRQTLAADDKFVVSNLPNKIAHDTLYSEFMRRASDVDLFCKIDADMVLQRDTFFEECADTFRQKPKLKHIQVAIDDWMTNRKIMGLHIFRSNHLWVKNNESIFVDMVDEDKLKENDWDQLAPAAIHCPNPSPFQAYHFGLHKAVKFVQKDRKQVQPSYRITHWQHFVALSKNYQRILDRRLGLAILGFYDAFRFEWGAQQVDFLADEPRSMFEEWNAMTSSEIKIAVKEASPFLSSTFPDLLRFELARLKVEKAPFLKQFLQLTARLIGASYYRGK